MPPVPSLRRATQLVSLLLTGDMRASFCWGVGKSEVCTVTFSVVATTGPGRLRSHLDGMRDDAAK